MPTSVFLRTKLLCEYIQEGVGVSFGLHDFLMVLYLDFIQKSIKKYDAQRLHYEITNTYGYNESIKVKSGDDLLYELKKRETSWTTLLIEMGKKDVFKGEILLAEVDELYGMMYALKL